MVYLGNLHYPVYWNDIVSAGSVGDLDDVISTDNCPFSLKNDSKGQGSGK